MRRWVKFLVIAMLVAFAASTVVQSAQMTAMNVTMTLDDGACSNCPSDRDGSVGCANGCVVPNVGFNDTAIVLHVPGLSQVLLPAGSDALTTWQTPPEPYPPRLIVLS